MRFRIDKVFFVVVLLALLSCSSKDNSANYRNNRSPLITKPYIELPLGNIKARGWLLMMLEAQRTGATGHLDELYPQVMNHRNGWLGGDGDQWERGPYWIDGLLPLAYILEDTALINLTKPWVEWMISSQREDGYFGPSKDYDNNEPGLQRDNAEDWWPKMVALKILQQYYSATGDDRVIDLMTNYFKYQYNNLEKKPLDNWTFWARYRGGDNLMMVYWLYNITGEKYLLFLAQMIHEQTENFTDDFLERERLSQKGSIHCVNLAQGFKEPVIYYQQSKDHRYLDAVKVGLKDLRNFNGYPNGMYGGDEALHGNNPVQGIELCSVVEFMYSLENMLQITGDNQFAEHLERIAFNALPAQVTDDFMNRQYFQQVNQVKVSKHIRNFDINHNGLDNCFGLLNGYPCCTSNMHQGWPKFTQNLWYATADKGLAKVVYAPSKVRALVGDSVEVSLVEDTYYPFENSVNISIESMEKSTRFPLTLRIPEWSSECFKVKLNGELLEDVIKDANNNITIDRQWHKGDKLELNFAARVSISRWYENSATVERGPLVYALKMDEKWKLVENKEHQVWQGKEYWTVDSDSPWNYGLIEVPDDELEEHYEVIESFNENVYPWNTENAPIRIKTKAKRLPFWKVYNDMTGPLPYSIMWGPEVSEKKEEITLIPYGCTALRITEFPLLGEHKVK
ncbi:beta-L-arabinofuranosidase domain-containing protein [Saccharicrinis sp. FJH62]|uniref:beta-L-arabinofuranosidase domain-containing protein n=1 Tax=Saccharicrinis sp. FJH62 TaxID=3344657 RepID=UPI0035D507AB